MSVSAKVGTGLLIAFATGWASAQSPAPSPSAGVASDEDILNFALNLEYLEAEFYSCAAFGTPLASNLRGGGPASTGCQKAKLSPLAQQVATEFAKIEIGHVILLRDALGASAAPLPQLNIGSAFSHALAAAGSPLSPPFSPYASDILFVLGAFIFEDVGVTAYEGVTGQIRDVAYLEAAANIAAVEAYQAGITRSFLFQANSENTSDWPYQRSIASVVQSICNVRDCVVGRQGILNGTALTLVPTNQQALLYARTPTQVIDVVTLGNGLAGGGWFPNGLSGDVDDYINLSSDSELIVPGCRTAQ